jgi:phosphomannomutase/phosphoglucomutase
LSKAFIEGATPIGMDVTDVGTTSFGVTLFSGWNLKKDVTAYITASHNPPEWNGIKFYDKDCVGFFEEANLEIGRIALKEDFEKIKTEKGRVDSLGYTEKYKQYLTKVFDFKKPLKVVVDCGNGSTSLSAPHVFNSFRNLEAKMIFHNVDPMFSDRGADVEEENLQKLRNMVIEENADMGIAFDGDGDRLAIVDDKGNILNGNQILILLGKDLLAKQKGTVITNVEGSMTIEEVLGPLGGNIIRIPVGHTFMMQNARKYNAILGAESSKHYVIPSYFPFDDAFIPSLKIIEMLSNTDKKMSELAGLIPTYSEKRFNVECSDKTKFKVMENLKNKLSQKYDKVSVLDGIRIDFENGWALIRASNTVPLIRLTVEALDDKALDDIKSNFLDFLNQEIKNVK